MVEFAEKSNILLLILSANFLGFGGTGFMGAAQAMGFAEIFLNL